MFSGWKDKDERSAAARVVNPRGAERHQPDKLGCCLGLIVDLSETGMQVEFHGKPPAEVGAQMKFTIKSPIQSLSVSGQVMWVKQRWMRAGYLGVKYINTPPALARALVELACHGFVDTTSLSGAGPLPGSGSVSSASGTNAHACGGAKSSSGNSAQAREARAARGISAQVEMEDYYAALGLLASADAPSIHAAYRKLAMQLHPDMNKAHDSADRFAFISRGYAILKDPVKRLAYDEAREARQARESAAKSEGGSPEADKRAA